MGDHNLKEILKHSDPHFTFQKSTMKLEVVVIVICFLATWQCMQAAPAKRGSLDSLGGGNILFVGENGEKEPRQLDSIGGGNILALFPDKSEFDVKPRGLDSLGGGNLLRTQLVESHRDEEPRQLDSIGGGNILRFHQSEEKAKRGGLDSLGGGNILFHHVGPNGEQ